MNKLKFKYFSMLLSATLITATITPTLYAATTTSQTTQSTPNISPWAEKEVKAFLGASYSSNVNYKYKATRAEFAEILEKTLTDLGVIFEEPTSNPFKDTNNKSAIKLAKLGYVAGMSETEFGPALSLTREQLAALIVRVYEKMGVPMSATKTFYVKDADKIAPWALNSVRKCYQAGIIVGEGDIYNPKTTVSREQSIIIMSRVKQSVTSYKVQQEELKKAQELQDSKVKTTDLYIYDIASKTITIKQSCKLDASVAGTPTDFTKVIVNAGVNVELKGIKVGTITTTSNSKVTLTGCTVDTIMLNKSNLVADKSTTIKTLMTVGKVDVDAEDTSISKTTIYEGASNDKVTLEIAGGDLSIEAPVDITIKGTYGTVTLTKSGISLSTDTTITTLTIKATDCEVEVSGRSKVSTLNVNAESELTITNGAKVKKLVVNEDGEASDIILKSKYDMDIKVNASCKLNGKKVTKKSKISYESGKLIIDDKDVSGRTKDEDADLVDDVYDELTAKVVLGKNESLDKVTKDLDLVTKLKDCTITWFSDNEAVIDTDGTVTRLAKNKEVQLRAKIISGEVSRNKTFNVTVLGTSTEEDAELEARLLEDLQALSIPSSISTSYNLLKTSARGYSLTYSANNANVSIVNYVLTPTQTNANQIVTLTITATYNNVSKSVQKEFTIPASTSLPPTTDYTTLQNDMEAKLNTYLSTLPSEISTTLSIPKYLTSGLSNTLPYVLEVKTSDPGLLEISETDSVSVITAHRQSVAATSTLTFTASYDLTKLGDAWEGTTTLEVNKNKTFTVPALSSGTTDVKAFLETKITTHKATIPTVLTGTSAPISCKFNDFIDGKLVDYNMAIDIPLDSTKLSKTTNPDGTVVLIPNVLDGSTVTVQVYLTSIYNSVTYSTDVQTVTITLGTPSTEYDWDGLVVNTEVFGILKEVDISLFSVKELPSFRVEIYDKYLAQLLGSANVTLTGSGSSYTENVTITLSKEAILGEYTYKIIYDSKEVKTGDF